MAAISVEVRSPQPPLLMLKVPVANYDGRYNDVVEPRLITVEDAKRLIKELQDGVAAVEGYVPGWPQ